MKNFKVLGIDASLTGTGLSIVDREMFEKREVKTYTCKNDLIGVERLLYIEEIVSDWARDVDLVVIENYAFNRTFNREVLAELQGVLKRRVFLMKKPLLIVETQKVKKILTGFSQKPRELKNIKIKNWTISSCRDLYGYDFDKRDNECDAYGLSLIGLFYLLDKNKELFEYPYEFIKEIVEDLNKPKYKKKSIKDYIDLPYRVIVLELDDGVKFEIPDLDISRYIEDKDNIEKEILNVKSETIKSKRKNKERIRFSKINAGKLSYIVKKSK